MYNRTDSRSHHSLQSVDDDRLRRICKKHTDLLEEDLAYLIEASHNLRAVSDLEDCDIFIDCLTRDQQYAVVIAQYSPHRGTFYQRNIVGEFMYRYNEPGVFRTLEIGVPSRELKAVVSEDILIRQNVSAIRNGDGKILGVLIMERNLRSLYGREDGGTLESEQNPQEVRGGREMYNIADHIDEAMIHFNTMGTSVYANYHALQIYRGLGYQDDIVGMHFENLCFGNYTLEEVIEREHIDHTMVKIGKFILSVLYSTIYEDDQCIGVVMLIKDTTEEKIKEKELILKSTAIVEMHHRIKNNLQTIVSLIRLQSRRVKQPEVRRVFSEIISRIYSIAVTHEILAQKGVDNIDVKEMLGRMLNTTKQYIIPDGLDLTMEILGDNIYLQSDTASTVAMVINELLQNSIKYAFVGRDHGCISITINNEDPFPSISVADNGVGFQGVPRRADSLGHKLVKSLVEDKLRGNLFITTSHSGTISFFDFPSTLTQQKNK